MNRIPRALLLPLFFCLAAALPGWGKKEAAGSPGEQGVPVRVSGRVRLVGSEPFPSLVITGPEKEWYIDKEDEQKLKDLQQRTVIVEGSETVKKLTFANGRPAGERRTLKDVKIISVQ